MTGTPTSAVVVNDDGQHAVWPAAEQVPDGWRAVGVQGTEERCLDYIEIAWDDLRPRSLRDGDAADVATDPSGAITSSIERDLVLGATLAQHPGTDLIGGLLHTDRTLDPTLLALAWADVTARYPMLRTRYALRSASGGAGGAGGSGVERVVAITDEHLSPPTWTSIALDPTGPRSRADQLREAALSVHRRSPEFGQQAGLLHAFDAGPDGTAVLVSHLHAVLDGRSLVRVVTDLLDAYQQREDSGAAPVWSEPAADFRGYREYAARRWATTDRAYWRTHAIRDGDSPRLTHTAFGEVTRPVTHRRPLPEDLSDAAGAAVEEVSVPLSTLVYLAWARLLARRSGASSATFATTLAQRFGSGEQAPQVGNGVATMPLTVLLDAPIADVLRETRHTLLSHRDHAWGSWGELLTWAGTPGAAVESLVVLDRSSLQDRVRQACPQWQGVTAETLRHTAFGVVLHVYTDPGLNCELTVDGDVSAQDAAALLAEFEAELTEVVDQVRRGHATQQQAGAAAAAPAGSAVASVDRVGYGIPYAPGWSLWPDAVLRSAAVEFAELEPLGDPALARVADDTNANSSASGAPNTPNAPNAPDIHDRFVTEFAEAGRRLNRALHAAARDPRITEALAWQNRSALSNGVGPLLRRDPETVRRNGQHRQHEAMLASYLQRYAAKNDTIGFFGPVGWARLAPGAGTTVRPGQWPVDRRSVHLEGWVLRAIADRYAADLRPWLVPRLVPHVRLTDDPDAPALRVPLADPIPLTDLQQRVLGRVDGRRSATQIAEAVRETDPRITPSAVAQVLHEASDARRLRWEFDLPHQDATPLETLRAQLEALRVPNGSPGAHRARSVRERALRDLDDLARAQRRLADAAGHSDAVAEAMADLEALVATLTGGTASRHQGKLYAGRTPAYEECRLGAEVTVGTAELDRIAEPLEVVLNASRWFAHACSEAFHTLLQQLHARRSRELGSSWVPLSDIWVLAVDYLMDPEEHLLAGPSAELAQRWARVLDLPQGWERSEDEVRLDAAGALHRSRIEFAVPEARWSLAAVHSPDLMYLPGDEERGEPPRWVLGEVHPAQNTLAYRTWVDLLEDPTELLAAAEASNGPGRVWLTPVDELKGRPTRLTYALAGPHDRWLAVSESATGTAAAMTIRGADAMVGPGPGGLRVSYGETGQPDRSGQSGRHEQPVMEVLADVVSGSLIQHFDVIGKRPGRTARVSLGDLVLARRTWRFEAADQSAWANLRSESDRYLAVRRWAADHDLPRYVFMRTTGELKPVFLDLTGLASVDLLARAVRRSVRESQTATLTVSEMLPGPDDLWLTGPDGKGRTAELRLVAVDATATPAAQGER